MKDILEKNLLHIRKKIFFNANICNRDPKNILLVAVSKSRSVEEIKCLNELGQVHFGENYVQEAVKKIEWFRKNLKGSKLVWHFIGFLQSNKIKKIVKYFDWCQTLDRIKIAKKLHDQCLLEKKILNVLIQINLSREINRAGIDPKNILTLSNFVSKCSQLKFRGLMAFPNSSKNLSQELKKIQKMFLSMKEKYPIIDTLSLGTSKNLSDSILSGSTMLRIGNDIFKK